MTRSITLAALVLLAMLGGCATTPSRGPMAKGQTVAIVAAVKPTADGKIDIRHEGKGHGLIGGALAGAGLGALSGVWFACGPFGVACLSASVAAGTVAGGAFGAAAAISETDAARVRERLAQGLQSRGWLAELDTHLTVRAAKHFVVSADHGDKQVIAELQELWFGATAGRVQYKVRVMVTLQPSSGAEPSMVSSRKLYEYASPPTTLAALLDESKMNGLREPDRRY